MDIFHVRRGNLKRHLNDFFQIFFSVSMLHPAKRMYHHIIVEGQYINRIRKIRQ